MSDKKFYLKEIPLWREVSKQEYLAAAEAAGYPIVNGRIPFAFSDGKVMGRTKEQVKLRSDETGVSREQAH